MENSKNLIYLFTDYLMTFSNYRVSNDAIINEYWIGKDLEESGHGLISGIILVLA
jgi:hypothetical protein